MPCARLIRRRRGAPCPIRGTERHHREKGHCPADRPPPSMRPPHVLLRSDRPGPVPRTHRELPSPTSLPSGFCHSRTPERAAPRRKSSRTTAATFASRPILACEPRLSSFMSRSPKIPLRRTVPRARRWSRHLTPCAGPSAPGPSSVAMAEMARPPSQESGERGVLQGHGQMHSLPRQGLDGLLGEEGNQGQVDSPVLPPLGHRPRGQEKEPVESLLPSCGRRPWSLVHRTATSAAKWGCPACWLPETAQ